MKRPVFPGRPRKRHGASVRNCCSPTWTGLRHRLKWRFGTFPSWKMSASNGLSTGPSLLHPMAIRWWGRCVGVPTSGRLAASWLASARAAGWAWPCRTGWSMAIQALTSGAWTWPAMATGRPGPIPTPRYARTMRAASVSVSPMKSCRLDARCRPHRCTTP